VLLSAFLIPFQDKMIKKNNPKISTKKAFRMNERLLIESILIYA